MNYILFEDQSALDLLPLTFTRPVWEIRVGIDTLREKWARLIGEPVYTYIKGYLGEKFERLPQTDSEAIFINAKFAPMVEFVAALRETLKYNELWKNKRGEIVAFRVGMGKINATTRILLRENIREQLVETEIGDDLIAIRQAPDIFRFNGQLIKSDFAQITAGRKSTPIDDPHTVVYSSENIFVEEGATITAAILNARSGPIYLGAGADIQEGAILHGSHAVCAHAVVNMGAKLRGDSTIGPYCKVGGEVSNSVLFGYSNKGHDGFLGNSVLGEWCNLGADTNVSNLKNNYSRVSVYNYREERQVLTELQFCGLIMGDHSKSGINTMFNTGTVAGVSANVFGGDFPPKMIPSFSWGGARGFETFQLEKANEVAERMMGRRNIPFDGVEKRILEAVFNLTKNDRAFDVTY